MAEPCPLATFSPTWRWLPHPLSLGLVFLLFSVFSSLVFFVFSLGFILSLGCGVHGPFFLFSGLE